MDYARSTSIAVSIGQAIAWLLGLWGLFGGGFTFVLIAIFIYIGAGQEGRSVQVRNVLQKYIVEQAYSRQARTLTPQSTLREAIELTLSTSQADFAVTLGDCLVGFLTQNRLIESLKQYRPEIPVSEVMLTDVPTVTPSEKMSIVQQHLTERELEALINCRDQAAKLGLKGLKFAKAEFSYDGKRLTFLYSVEGDESVVLKELRKRMRKAHRKSRIEMRQVGPRDVAKLYKGMGACGMEERCCSKFLTEFSPVSIRMAKAQGVSLNPQEITGLCGRLRCCLLYEYEEYVEARKHLPKRNKRVVTPRGEGKVVDVLPLKNAVIVQFDDERKIEFSRDEIEPYDELQAMKDKANQPCDIHRNGECTCGKR